MNEAGRNPKKGLNTIMRSIKYENVNGKKGLGSRDEHVWVGRCPRVSQPGLGRHPSTACSSNNRKVSMNFGCWNVRTLLNSESNKRYPVRRSALIGKETQRYAMDIVALSETRFLWQGNFAEKSRGYTFYWSGKEEKENCKKESDALKTSLVDDLEELPYSANDRMILLRLPLKKGRYVPTMNVSDNEKLSFYDVLSENIRKISHEDKIIILGDFNARVGKDHKTWGVIEKQSGKL
ncbi:uncharacterized protein LOC115215473 [Octopus sinensis]|uniref:Uncharacterized protein LOC115215473 n=1 Tax=Octopus sinensis TaxID=2607531 RepID=A0A6P7SQ49_9MOLL|nr:uncharacterized protein LOC115215473 [Octopus sinensis]